MSIAQIEAELKGLSADELRRLALNSWAAYVQKEGGNPAGSECDEDDPLLLAALDEAVRRAGQPGSRTMTGAEVRTKIRQWTTK